MPNLLDAADKLRKQLRSLAFPDPVSHTYNPLDYAWERHCDYLTRFGAGTKQVLNPLLSLKIINLCIENIETQKKFA